VPQLFIITAALSASTGAGIVAMQSLPPVEVFGQRFEPPRLNLFPSEQSFPPRQGWPVYNGRTVEESGDGLGDEGDLGPVDDALDKAPERIYSPRDRGPSLRSLPVAPVEAPRPQELEMDQREDVAPSLEERPSFEPAIAPEADERPIRRSLGSDGDRPTPYNNSNPAAAPRSPIGGNGSGPTAPNNNSPDPAGQLLAAMLVAYEHNLAVPELKEKPVYGAYVIGRLWYFVVLKAKEYDISLAYDATHEDQLLDIFRILKANRQQIREIWGE